MKIKTILLPALTFLCSTTAALAATGSDDQKSCTTCTIPNFLGTIEVTEVVARVINYGIYISGTLAMLVFIWGAMQWVFSFGDPKKITLGKEAMIWSAIGLGFIFASGVIVARLYLVISGA